MMARCFFVLIALFLLSKPITGSASDIPPVQTAVETERKPIAASTSDMAPKHPAVETEKKPQENLEDKNTKYFYENGKIVRSETDKNGDGKPDFFCQYRQGVKVSAKADTDFDGKIDTWFFYNEKGALYRRISDTDQDGKIDTYYEFPDGSRQFVWREYDRNGDGKIDKRVYKEWMPDRKVTVILGNRATQIPTPTYVTLVREEDNNYDGIIDVFYEKGNKVSKVGQPINPVPIKDRPAQDGGDERPSDQRSKKTRDEAKIDQLNEKLALTQ